MSAVPNANTPRFHPVKSRRLFEEVCEQVRDQIASGELKAGDKLPAERELAQQFGVSRSAVREALRSLEFAGIISLQKGVKGGSFVLGPEKGLQISFQNLFGIGRLSLVELTEARVEVQDAVVRLAVINHDAKDIKALERDIVHTQKCLDLGTGSTDPFATQQFYALLAEASRNRVLMIMVQALSQLVYQAIEPLGTPLNFDIVAVRKRFVEAMKARNVEKSCKIMRDYLHFLHDYVIKAHEQLEAAE